MLKENVLLLFQVLRLVCMQSVTNSGLKPKILEHYKREIIQTYGFQHILSLRALENVGLIKLQVAITICNEMCLALKVCYILMIIGKTCSHSKVHDSTLFCGRLFDLQWKMEVR